MANEHPPPLSISVFGRCDVRVHGAPLPRLRSRKGLWLLALLLLRHRPSPGPPAPVERAWLAGTLWPDAPEEQAYRSLRVSLADLRAALGPEGGRLLAPTSRTLALALEGAQVDLIRFDATIAAGRAERLEEAVDLYRGPLLEECEEEWVLPHRRAREQAYLEALERLAEVCLQAGEPTRAEGYLRRAVTVDPLREGAHRRLMQTLAAGGNTAAAVMVYRDLRLLLHRELRAEPDPETRALYDRLRAAAHEKAAPRSRLPTPARTASGAGSPEPEGAARGNLPSPTTLFIGREREMAEVKARLTSDSHAGGVGTRLLTLTGAGGCGKTRLALEVGKAVSTEFSDGVWWVELAALADPSWVPQAVGSVLGVPERPPAPYLDVLLDHLQPRSLLLLLDNCEHLLDACARLAHSLLARCPRLRLLATSREPLALPGEQAYRVPCLSLPDPLALPPDPSQRMALVVASEAGQLFLDRALATCDTFRLTSHNAATIAQICRRLDGIPLAIELAAARVPVLSPEQIAERLDDRFRLLTRGSRTALPRQQTLRALIDWSHDLLSAPERVLYRRLSVFRGGWTLAAAEAVSPDGSLAEEEVLPLLTALVEKSLVVAEREEAEGAVRYRMLETLREYAEEQLVASGEVAAVRGRHRDWYLEFAEQAEIQEAYQPERKAWLKRLDAEIDNLRAALEWCQAEADGDAEGAGATSGLRLAVAIPWLRSPRRDSLMEGLQWLEGALARGARLPAALRAPALFHAAILAARLRHGERADHFFQAARCEYETVLTIARNQRNRAATARALLSLADIEHRLANWDTAWDLCVEARQLWKELGDAVGLARTLDLMAGVPLARGDLRTARPLLEESLAIWRRLKDAAFLIHALGAMGHLERNEGNFSRARAHYQESLALRREMGYLFAQAQSLEDLAGLAAREGMVERAIRLLGAGEALCETLGARPPTADGSEYKRTVAAGRAILGEASFAATWARGRAMSLEEAVQYALEEPATDAAQG